ncbi:MAG TPA: Gfo/Idh/MocA family oxidoreductase, partial [bacterium]|nr:Gfo/Idh/MocA family oxidoreductase [bacterium]
QDFYRGDLADRIAAAAEDKAAYVYTDYHKRHDYSIRALRHRYLAGELGEALCASAYIEERREMPLKNFARWAQASNSFDYIGCHYVDVFYYVTGLRPKRVTAYGQKKMLASLGHDIYDAVQALVEWENGAVLYVQTSWVLPDGNPNLTNQGFQMTGTQGEYRADHADRGTNFCTQPSGYDRFNPYFCKPYRDWNHPERIVWEGYGIESVIQPLEDILSLHQSAAGLSPERRLAKRREILAGLIKTRPLPEQAMVATAVLEAAHRSLAAGSVPVPVEF